MVIAASPIVGLTALARSPAQMSGCEKEIGNSIAVPHRRTIIVTLLVLAGLLLFVAWWDGGREDQRLITQPVDVPELSE